MVWTRFMDMHSGGGQKLSWAFIYIEAPQAEAEVIFQNRFNRNPNRVTCTCCGEDYSIDEEPTLEESTAFDRGCKFAYFDKDGKEIPEEKAWIPGKGTINGAKGRYVECQSEDSWRHYVPLAEFVKQTDKLFIHAQEIKPKEKKGELHEEGYVWRDAEDD